MRFGYPDTVMERADRATSPPPTRTIPFDHVFEFQLTGTPANKVQDVVDVSMQGYFVGVSIGYSFVLDERTERRRSFGPVFEDSTEIFLSSGRPVSSITLGEIAAGLERIGLDATRGFRVSSNFARFLDSDLSLDQIPEDALASAFEPGCGTEDISFFYSIDVPSTGRELQNKAVHNVAGLGIANGDRPFRPLARPIAFEPRTSIRIQVEEVSTLPGTLYIVLQGYKTLGTARIPD